MDLRFTGLREADGQGEDEKEGENGDDPLERVEFSLHCGESSLAGGLLVIGSACPIRRMGSVALCPTPKIKSNKISQ